MITSRYLLSIIAGSAVLAVPAASAPAKSTKSAPPGGSAACPGPSSASPVFAQWGDAADYFAAPGGLFDDGVLGWEPVGAPSLVPADNPYAATAKNNVAVALNGGDMITSPPICITRQHPFLRFAARGADQRARLVLTVLYVDKKGKAKRKKLKEHEGKDFRSWSLSERVSLKKVLPEADAVRSVRLEFAADGSRGQWLVDDVFIDPVKSG